MPVSFFCAAGHHKDGGGGGSRRRFRPVLSAVEGNPRSKLTFWRDSSVSVDFHASALRRANHALRSKQLLRVSASLSTPLLFLDCVPGSGVRDLQLPRRKKSHRRSEECSRRTWCARFASRFGVPFDRAQGTKSWSDLVEAGGVEPPSERPCSRKTTCLAGSGAA